MIKRLVVLVLVLGMILANFYTPFRVEGVHIVLRPEAILTIGAFRLTNTLLTSWLSSLVLIGFSLLATRKLRDVPPPRSLQNLVETILEALYNFMQRFAGEQARDFFPVVAGFFLFILTANWLGLLPGMGSIGVLRQEAGRQVFVPLFRGATTDLNTTVALAICTVLATQIYGVRSSGLGGYLMRYVAIGRFLEFFRQLGRGQKPEGSLLIRGVLDLFVGFLELFDELTKILSFSFRLFGNIFGGEVLLLVMAFLAPYVLGLPFWALELLGGFIQAFIFAVLSTAFYARAASVHAERTS